jgi:acetoin utilization deacetylase AcuC-like enzyme
VTAEIKKVADRYSQGLVSVLEGGYELHALGRSVPSHLKVLAELRDRKAYKRSSSRLKLFAISDDPREHRPILVGAVV